MLCKRKKNVVIREDTCKHKETQLNPADLRVTGPAGTAGAAGADGQLRIYGNGSAGARTVPADQTLADENLQYTDFTVAAGATRAHPGATRSWSY